MTGDGRDEFSFLADEAADLGLAGPLPPVRRVEADGSGAPVSALSWGEPPARAVLLHGAALNAHTWDATLLSWGLPALAVDLPGHGESAWRADGDYAPTTIGPVVADALRQWAGRGLMEPPVVLVGQSLGGLTAVVAAAGDPGLVSRVVLVDILPLPAEAAREVAAFLAGPSEFASREQIVERALSFGLGGGGGAVRRAVHLNTREREDGVVVWKHHLAVLEPGTALRYDTGRLWSAIEGLDVPVDLVRAGRGLLDEGTAAELARRVPGSRTVRIDAGHNVQEDAPAELALVLAALLAGDVP